MTLTLIRMRLVLTNVAIVFHIPVKVERLGLLILAGTNHVMVLLFM